MNKEDDSIVDMDAKNMYEKTISDLTRQLYDAYKRIKQLHHELRQKREKNGQD